MQPEVVALVTAALTLANTVLLFFINRKSTAIKKHVNGMQLQLLAEAERRGRRRERQKPHIVVED